MTPFFQREGVTIYHAKAEHVLPRMAPFDLLLTDPPYGIGEARARHESRSKKAKAKSYGSASWDDNPPPAWLIEQARALCREQIIFGGNFLDLPPSRCWLVWDKENGENDFADCELAWTNLDRAVRIIKHRWAGMLKKRPEERFHPTQKPLDVMRWALQQATPPRRVLDPFMGSGTTLVACRERGLEVVGIEQSEEYCRAAVGRMAQGELFAGGAS